MVYNILYHGLSLVFLFLTSFDFRDFRKRLSGSLETVFISTATVILSDCCWNVMEWLDYKPLFLCYLVNITYYIAETVGICAWAWYSLNTVRRDPAAARRIQFWISIPAVLIAALVLSTPATGFFFNIVDGEYVRGPLFLLDSLVMLSYLSFSILYAFAAAKKEPRKYLQKRIRLLGVFCFPVLAGGILQVATGLDFDCVAPVLALSIVHRFGLSNNARDKESRLNAIGHTYDVTFVIDVDSHSISTLSANEEYSHIEQFSNAAAHNYEESLVASIRSHVLPEDRIMVEKSFSLKNLLNQLETKGVYSVVYKTQTSDTQEQYNKATFLKAFNNEDRREIILGIEKLETRQLIAQREETLAGERDDFERVKESLTNVLANIIEARDMESGEHVLRVKNFTQYLCNRVMEDCPEYGLTPLKVRHIVQGSALHDIGKIMISDSILLKPDRLTMEEIEIMKTHCELGCEILDKLPGDLDEDYIAYAREICRWHHEKYDGNGYPDGLVGDSIPISAQIVSLADCFDALTSSRIYKSAFSPEEAFRMIVDGECGKFSKRLLSCFDKAFDQMKTACQAADEDAASD